MMVLQLLCPRVPGDRIPDAPLDDIPLKQMMHTLQRNILGLRHAKDRVDAHEYTASPK